MKSIPQQFHRTKFQHHVVNNNSITSFRILPIMCKVEGVWHTKVTKICNNCIARRRTHRDDNQRCLDRNFQAYSWALDLQTLNLKSEKHIFVSNKVRQPHGLPDGVTLQLPTVNTAVNPLLPWVTKIEFLLTNQFNVKQTSDENKETYQFRELLLDLTPNSLTQHRKNSIAHSKDNYQWDLEVEWVKM